MEAIAVQVDGSGFVDDSACAECHQELYESYQHVGMAQSFFAPTQEKWIENFASSHYYHPATDRHYEMVERGNDIFQARYQTDSEGQQKNRLEIKVDAVLGSGNHVRSYLYRAPSGEYFQMPLAWYSGEQKWRLNPGYDNANHLGFQRKITRECMFCHNAFPVGYKAGSDAHWQPHLFPEKLPQGIGCQRCHGPGLAHVDLANSGATAHEINEAIVNPSNLSQERSEDVCLQCHLQPSSQIVSEFVREDRGEFSFRPGEALVDFRALVDYSSGKSKNDHFEINHHAYRMHQSECYVQSKAMTCTTCHNPHQRVADELRVSFYRDKCLECHKVETCSEAQSIETSREIVGQPHSPEGHATQGIADCVACHMPKRRTNDVIHAVMTDHKIVAKIGPENERLAAKTEPASPNKDTRIFAYRNPTRNNQTDKSVDLYAAIASSDLGNQRALQLLKSYVASAGKKASVLALSELARAAQKQGDFQTELDALLQTVNQFPDHVQANLEMGMALAAIGRPEQANVYYQNSLRIGPPLPETFVGIGMTMLARNELTRARENFAKAVTLRPYYPEALINLGITLFALGELDESKKILEAALAADPSFVEAEQYLGEIAKRKN
ncbi:MAG: tetratricopeptide repeat protein [Pirellulaceae bacterium]